MVAHALVADHRCASHYIVALTCKTLFWHNGGTWSSAPAPMCRCRVLIVVFSTLCAAAIVATAVALRPPANHIGTEYAAFCVCAALYVLVGLPKCSYWPPTPLRAAVLASMVTSMWWFVYTAWRRALDMPQHNGYDVHRTAQVQSITQNAAAAYTAIAVICTVQTAMRMCMEQYRATAHERRRQTRRRQNRTVVPVTERRPDLGDTILPSIDELLDGQERQHKDTIRASGRGLRKERVHVA